MNANLRWRFLIDRICLIALFFWVTPTLSHRSSSAAADDEIELQRRFDSGISEMLRQRCGDCHWGQGANAGIDFESFKSVEDVLNADHKWDLIAEQIKSGSMPPAEEEPLTAHERTTILNWVAAAQQLVSCDSIWPGEVTVRRLNRREYRNTIRDLLGIDFAPAEDFPGDDVGYGFDNIADVLSLPPLLLEKYLDAAESIADEAIRIPDQYLLDIDLSGSSFEPRSEHFFRGEGRLSLFTSDTAAKRIAFPASGSYALVVSAYGDQAGEEPVRMSVLLDDQLIESVDVKATKRDPQLYGFKIDIDESGTRLIQIRFENDFYVPRKIAPQDRNLHVMGIYVKGPRYIPSQKNYLRFRDKDRSTAAEFLNSFLPLAYRGNVEIGEQERLLRLFDHSVESGLSFRESMKVVVQAILVSPKFLFRFEGPVAPGKIRELNQFERATALAYFLWSSTPDEELLQLAKKEKLADPVVWHQQVHRMFNDNRSVALIDDFVTQWLNLRLLQVVNLDDLIFPAADRNLLNDMATETQLTVADLFRKNGRILDLLHCDYTFLNERLAKHYGIAGVDGAQFRKKSLEGTSRGGILTQASILTLTSNPNRTSPVKRGKWILENLLGQEPPPAPPEIVPLDEQTELTGTLKEKMQQHRSDPNCASCHATMDSLGFALENFDAIGRFRQQDHGVPIDATSELPDGTRLIGHDGLKKHLLSKQKQEFIRCFAEKLLTYALGRGLNYRDRCAVDKIVEQASHDEFRIGAFVLAIATSDPFLKRGTLANRND